VDSEIRLGADYLGGGRCRFTVWAPFTDNVEVKLVSPEEKVVPLERQERGYHQAVIEGVEPSSLYLYRLDGYMAPPRWLILISSGKTNRGAV